MGILSAVKKNREGTIICDNISLAKTAALVELCRTVWYTVVVTVSKIRRSTMKKYTKVKTAAVMLLIAMAASVFCACQNNSGSSSVPSENSTASQSEKADSQNADSSDPETELSPDSSETSSDNTDGTASQEDNEPTSIPELSDPDPEDFGYLDDGILVYQNTAYELFYGFDELAKDYAQTMSDIKNALGDDIKVYNVLVPTHCGVTLPQRIADEYGISDQKEYLDTIIHSYSADIIGINTFDTLMHHRNEYLYFNTDHHWTGLAAYYAYKDFCKAAGVDAVPLSKLEKGEIEGYYGSLTNYVDEDLLNVDTVEYYAADMDTSTRAYNSTAEEYSATTIIHSYAEGYNAYGVFLGGDNPLVVCKNNDGNGKKIAVVKESYGNAFCPYIAYTYGETHMIDFRYIEFDFLQYIKDNDIDEIIFINNAMASATPQRCEELQSLIS